MPFSYDLLGVDGGHMKDLIVGHNPRTLLRKLHCIVLSGRGPNMTVLIYGFVLTHSENSKHIGKLFELAETNGVNFNRSR